MTVIRVGRARIALPAAFYEVEALSPNGRRLFLIHWKNNGYDLQQLALRDEEAVADPARRAGREDERRRRSSSVATRDGRWLLTLYIKS